MRGRQPPPFSTFYSAQGDFFMHKFFGLLAACFVLFSLPHALADAPLLKPTFAMRGPIGPFPDAFIVTHVAKFDSFAATIIAHKDDKTVRFTSALATWKGIQVNSILSGQADKDADVEVLIVATYVTDTGPHANKEFSHAVVLDWQTDKFEAIGHFKSLSSKTQFTGEEAAKSIGFLLTQSPDPAAPATIDPSTR
jgi:hypothetical protein